MKLNSNDKINQWAQIISPNPDDGLWIHQNAWIHLGEFVENFKIKYDLKDTQNGVYVFVISGDFLVEGQKLSNRDAIGLCNKNNFEIESLSKNSELLLLEIPMNL